MGLVTSELPEVGQLVAQDAAEISGHWFQGSDSDGRRWT